MRRSGDFDGAEKQLLSAIDYFLQIEDEPPQINTYFALFNLALQRKKYQDAEKYIHQASKLANKANNKQQQTIVYGNFGVLAINLQNYPVARSWFEQELVLATQLGIQEFIGQAQHGLALAAEGEGNLHEALRLAIEARKIFEILGDSELHAVSNLIARIQSRKET